MIFIEKKATPLSIARRHLVHGAGVNDSDYITNPKINGRTVVCPYYRKWSGMMERCFSAEYKMKNPTYKSACVCDEWLLFSNFKEWMKNQDWIGHELDKDLLINGNKLYSPETCVFVSVAINKLITDKSSSKGKYPVGVSLHKQSGRFRARSCNGNGTRVSLGLFSSEISAFNAYCDFKYKLIKEIAENEIDPIKSALLRYKIQ